MSVRRAGSLESHGWRAALRVPVAAVATAAFLAFVAAGTALLAERPEQISGAHEAVAATATGRATPEEPGTPRTPDPAQEGSRSEETETAPGEAELVAVAGALIDSGVEDTSPAAAALALAIEIASGVL
jgi:hypothetical protein